MRGGNAQIIARYAYLAAWLAWERYPIGRYESVNENLYIWVRYSESMGGDAKTYGTYESEYAAVQAIIQCVKARLGYITIVIRSASVKN